MPPKISIVTPFLNGFDLLPDYERATLGAQLVIVDNGSDEETATALRDLPPERGIVIRNETNIGFAAANNQGYAKATGDVVIFLNSDIAADPAWLKLVADDVKDGALYGPSLQRQLVYGLWLPYIEGWCVAATRETWERLMTQPTYGHRIKKVDAIAAPGEGIKPGLIIAMQQTSPGSGPWDADAYPGPYWEDNDLCLRALEQDIALIQTQWPIQHKGGRSSGPLVKHGATFEQNRATFAARVGPVWERMQK